MEIIDRGYIGLYRVCNFGVIVGLLGQWKRKWKLLFRVRGLRPLGLSK